MDKGYGLQGVVRTARPADIGEPGTERVNLTACLLTPYAFRTQAADAAKQYPRQIVPFGFVDLDAPGLLAQVKDFHALGYRGLGELEFVKKPYTDPSYLPVYELANEYCWVVMFHTGIVLRRSVDQPENVVSYRMRAFHLEEIARRLPKLTAIGAHCGNPEYEWAAEVVHAGTQRLLRPQWFHIDKDEHSSPRI